MRLVGISCSCNHEPAGPHETDYKTGVVSCTVTGCPCIYVDLDILHSADEGIDQNGGDGNGDGDE